MELRSQFLAIIQTGLLLVIGLMTQACAPSFESSFAGLELESLESQVEAPQNPDLNEGSDISPEPSPAEGEDNTPAEAPPNGSGDSAERPPTSENWSGLTICSRLNFDGLVWPESLPVSERNAFALALNITGSFEGRGWDQITGNFDGQGISIGIFQQNLGQGSLQALMIKLHRQNPQIIPSILSPDRAKSFLNMLADWDNGFSPQYFKHFKEFNPNDLSHENNEKNLNHENIGKNLNHENNEKNKKNGNSLQSTSQLEMPSSKLEDFGFNHLDDPEKIAPYLNFNPGAQRSGRHGGSPNGPQDELQGELQSDLQGELQIEPQGEPHSKTPNQLQIQNTNRNQASVQWAIRNALDGINLKPEWNNELRALALTPAYRSIQFAEAQKIHQRARQLFFDYGKKELRSYLFFLDIVVQNGSIPQVDRNDYFDWLKQNPNSDEETRLFKILELRLRHVRPQWINDVRARKSAIILGRGVVHQSQRDFDREYCAQTKSLALGPVFKPPGSPNLP